MPTYAELGREPAWGAEFAPPNLERFYDLLRKHYNLGPSIIGGKGDYRHLSGYHRSRRWILESRYASRGTGDYSVQTALDKGGDHNWLAALDATLPTAELIAACKRLDAAVRAHRLPQVREWYGNVDGDQVVDGWDTLRDRAASSDSSHLWHLHISFYRSRANDDHTLLYQIITGSEAQEDGMWSLWYDSDNGNQLCYWDGGPNVVPLPPGTPAENVGWLYSGRVGGDNTAQAAAVGALTKQLLANQPTPGVRPHIAIPTAPLGYLRSLLGGPAAVGVDAEAVAAALLDSPGFADALEDAAFEGAQRAERE